MLKSGFETRPAASRATYYFLVALELASERAEAIVCDQKTVTNQIDDLRNSVPGSQIPKLASERATPAKHKLRVLSEKVF